MNEEFPSLTEDVLYCHRNGLLEDELGRVIFNNWKHGICDETIAKMFVKRKAKHKYRQAFYGVIPFKTPKLPTGDYVLGFDEKGSELFSYIQYLNAHTLTIAGSGAGKTTASYFKIMQIVPRIPGAWMFDLMKREFGVMRPISSKNGENLITLPGRSLKINPLQLPVGVEMSDWIPRIADMLIEVLELPARASKLLQAKLFPLYNQFEKQNLFPTLYDLFEKIKASKEANHQARIAILDSLEPILLSLTPKVLAYRQGWTTEILARKHICFELAGLSEVDKNLLLNTLILSEFTSRIARGISNPKMNLWICLDEAQRICNSSSRASAIASQIGLIRGTGIGMDLSLQGMEGVLPQISSNSAVKILGRCGSMDNYATAGRNMGLNSEQIHWAQMNLEPGLFICQLGEGKWRYPFIYRIPPTNLKRTDIGCQNNIDNLSGIPTVYASEFEIWGQTPEIHLPDENQIFDSEQELGFCKAVAQNPMQPSSTYPKIAGISSKNAKKIREQLVLKGFIKEHKLDSGGRGRSTLLLEILPAGFVAIQKYEGEIL
ncbi:MAG: hypothetical protein KAS23_05050 [Anaerohalosphaera sp.]|nr:hypothetical protein [Anaerohalosphaera sp.]